MKAWSVKIAIALSLSVGAAHADLKKDFKGLDSFRKGPFSSNYQQGSQSRTVTGEGWPKGEHLFQAAFRAPESGRKLAVDYDFYTANLFTTNYYELTGEYVYGNAYGSFQVDHNALLGKGAAAMPKAQSMVRHWSLEKHYVHYFPESIIAKGFRTWGVSDTANEIEYARYFFNFFLTAKDSTDDYSYLTAFLLLKNSPVGTSSSIDKARQLVAEAYDYFAKIFSANDPRLTRMREIRNAVHNQMSPDVISMIDRYDRDFPFYKKDGHTYLFKVQDILREYYAVGAERVAEAAAAADAKDIQALVLELKKKGMTIEGLFNLSNAVAELRALLQDVPYHKKTDTLLLISATAQLLNKELTSLKKFDSPLVVKTVFNAIYLEGFLITDNWRAYQWDLKDIGTAQAGLAALQEVAEIGQMTLNESFEPALSQWISVEPQMEYFVDNTLKSSALNTAAFLAEKISK